MKALIPIETPAGKVCVCVKDDGSQTSRKMYYLSELPYSYHRKLLEAYKILEAKHEPKGKHPGVRLENGIHMAMVRGYRILFVTFPNGEKECFHLDK